LLCNNKYCKTQNKLCLTFNHFPRNSLSIFQKGNSYVGSFPAWQVYEKEMEKSNVFELHNAEDSGMPVLEAQTVEDIELAFRGTSEKEKLN